MVRQGRDVGGQPRHPETAPPGVDGTRRAGPADLCRPSARASAARHGRERAVVRANRRRCGRHSAGLPWRDDELDGVLAAVDQLAADLTPAPVAVLAISEYLGSDFTGWRSLAQTPDDDRIDSWARTRLPELAALEATWSAHAAGETLLHTDLRADNMLLTAAGVVVVDWPHACLGCRIRGPGVLRPECGNAGRPRACRTSGKISHWAVRQQGSARGRRVRAGRLLHSSVVAACTTSSAESAELPGGAR